jgi:hypothetical protein
VVSAVSALKGGLNFSPVSSPPTFSPHPVVPEQNLLLANGLL